MVDNQNIVVDGAENIQVQKEPISFFNREPVAIMAVIRTGLLLAIGFGFDIDPEQLALIMAFVESVLFLWTRQQVTPFVASGTTPRVDNPVETPLVK